MNDKSYIGFINTHSKCISRHHNGSAVIQKVILVLMPLCVIKSCVVTGHRNSLSVKLFTDLLDSLAGQTVNNAALLRMLCDIFLHLCKLISIMAYCIKQVFSVKACHHKLWILKLKCRNDVLSDFLCSCCCKGTDNRPIRQLIYKLHDSQIAWSKILSPLRNTVYFINCEH